MLKRDSGYPQVEEKILRELAYGAVCSKIKVWFDPDLIDEQVVEKSKD